MVPFGKVELDDIDSFVCKKLDYLQVYRVLKTICTAGIKEVV